MDDKLFLDIDELLSNWDDKCIGAIIKKIREETTEFNQTQFAMISGIGRSAYCNLENGASSLDYKKMLLINKTLNDYYKQNGVDKEDYLLHTLLPSLDKDETRLTHSVSPTFLSDYMEKNRVMVLYNQLSETDKEKILNRMENMIEMYSDEDQIPTKRIPLIGRTACGDPIEAIETTEDFIETNELKATFALRADGDSMSPLINDGDVILIKQVEELNIGEIGIFQINKTGFSTDEKVTCKLLKSVKDGIMTLTPMNPAYDPIIANAQNEDIKIIGKYLSKLS